MVELFLSLLGQTVAFELFAIPALSFRFLRAVLGRVRIVGLPALRAAEFVDFSFRDVPALTAPHAQAGLLQFAVCGEPRQGRDHGCFFPFARASCLCRCSKPSIFPSSSSSCRTASTRRYCAVPFVAFSHSTALAASQLLPPLRLATPPRPAPAERRAPDPGDPVPTTTRCGRPVEN